MSNATPDTTNSNSDARRRRRSRGGRNRNNRNSNERSDRQNFKGNRPEGHQRGPRQGQGPRHEKPSHKAPAKKTLWQKILSLFGLYKEPVRPARPERKQQLPEGLERTPKPKEKQTAPKSNTRNARQQGEGGSRSGEGQPRRNQERQEATSARLYLGNLSYDSSESDLEDLFKGVGPVRRVEIVYNRRTHKSKGYGFVDMLSVDDAKRAIDVLNDQYFMGRQIVVSGAKTREYEQASREEETPKSEKTEAAAPAPAPAAAAAVATAPAAVAAVAEAAPVEAPAKEEPESVPFNQA